MGLEVLKNFDENNNYWLVKPVGDVDVYTSTEFKKILLDLIDEKVVDIYIDGEMLEYIDSTGLGVLISILKQLKEHDKKIIISDIKPSIKRLFELTSLNKVIVIKE